MQPTDVENAVFVLRLFQAVHGILLLIVAVFSIAAYFRRRPPVTEELYRDFATKSEVTGLRSEMRGTMSEYFTRQHINQSAIEDKFQAIMNMIGEVNGQLKRCPYFCKENG